MQLACAFLALCTALATVSETVNSSSLRTGGVTYTFAAFAVGFPSTVTGGFFACAVAGKVISTLQESAIYTVGPGFACTGRKVVSFSIAESDTVGVIFEKPSATTTTTTWSTPSTHVGEVSFAVATTTRITTTWSASLASVSSEIGASSFAVATATATAFATTIGPFDTAGGDNTNNASCSTASATTIPATGATVHTVAVDAVGSGSGGCASTRTSTGSTAAPAALRVAAETDETRNFGKDQK